jgi:hypothetical protein
VTRSWRVGAILATILVASACSATAPSIAPATPTAIPWPSSTDLETIRAVINSRAEGELSSLGLGNGTVDVGLRADAGDLAKQIVDAYGDRVIVTVGFFGYPDPAPVSNACPIAGILADPGSLRATLEMAGTQIASGATFAPTIRIATVGSARVALETSSGLQTYLFQPGDTRPIGTIDLASVGTGLETSVEPGRSVTIPGSGGTASCDIALGYTLPPGPYQARALVDFAPGPEGGRGPLVFWSDPADVQIVAAP